MTHRRNIWLGFLVSAGILFLTQCSPYAGNRILRVFFDGVPEADSSSVALIDSKGDHADSTGSVETTVAIAGRKLFVHYPYEDRECASCHNGQSLGSMTEPQPGLCYICHEDLSDRYNYLHGPVAGGYCTACHDPHQSENQYLIRIEGDELCFYCHRKEVVFRNDMHEGLEGMLCTDCHNPHGGEDNYILQ